VITLKKEQRMEKTVLLCRPCAEKLKTENKVKIKNSVADKNTCACCGKRKFVYLCENLDGPKNK